MRPSGLPHLFFVRDVPISPLMSNFLGWAGRARGFFTDNKGPWGPTKAGMSLTTRAMAMARGVTPPQAAEDLADGPGVALFDELLRRGRMRSAAEAAAAFPGRASGSIDISVQVALVLLWLARDVSAPLKHM